MISHYRARWQGVDYAASPEQRDDGVWLRLRSAEPAEGFAEAGPGCHIRAVPAAECEAVHHVTMECRWQDAPCVVRDERGDKLLLEYTGGRMPVARALGMERIERGVHRLWVARDQVTDLRENAVSLEI